MTRLTRRITKDCYTQYKTLRLMVLDLSVVGIWELMSPRGGVIFNPSGNICCIVKHHTRSLHA